MRLLKFTERFNLEMDSQEARRRFMLRMNASFFQSDFFQKEIRTHHDVLAQKAAAALLEQYRFYTTPLSYIGDDFYRCLQVIEVMYQHFQEMHDRERLARMDTLVRAVLAHDSIRLALEWKDGRFFPTGPDLLDRALIEETLTWLHVLDSRPMLDAYALAIEHFIRDDEKGGATALWFESLNKAVLLFLKISGNLTSNDVSTALSTWAGRFPEASFGRRLSSQLGEHFRAAAGGKMPEKADREALMFHTATFFRWNIETVYRRKPSS